LRKQWATLSYGGRRGNGSWEQREKGLKQKRDINVGDRQLGKAVGKNTIVGRTLGKIMPKGTNKIFKTWGRYSNSQDICGEGWRE